MLPEEGLSKQKVSINQTIPKILEWSVCLNKTTPGLRKTDNLSIKDHSQRQICPDQTPFEGKV